RGDLESGRTFGRLTGQIGDGMNTQSHDAAIVASEVRKYYSGRRAALDGFNLTVESGTVHGLLGPNGAGKTTAMRILATLQHWDSGCVRVGGRDVASD